ncbi:MAG: 2Fe-2S iron-sulfur cluster-binding protein [Actinomycetota bacterium]
MVFETSEGRTSTTVGRDEYILAAGRRAGLELPSMCEQGWCTTCAVRVLEGEIDQSDSLRFYEEDREAGYGLICTGKPLSRLRIRTHVSPEMRNHRRVHGLPAPRATGL